MRERYFPEEENQELQSRIYLLLALILLVMILFLVRAHSLQIQQGGYFEGLAENNRVRAIPLPAARGFIYDRHGTPLVNNIPGFDLYGILADMPDPRGTLTRLAQLVAIADPARIEREMRERRDIFSPIKIKGGLSLAEIARVEGHTLELPGVRVAAELRRNVIYGAQAAHLIGYVGEISKKQMASGRYPGLRSGETIGQFGIEQTYDALIRGVPGQKWIEVDVLGHEVRPLRVKKPIEGNDIFLTLDWNLQQTAETVLGEESGAIVAIDPQNGDILAMVSHPSFDPNQITGGRGGGSKGGRPEKGAAVLTALLNDPARPLINRAIQGQYPPGSTFKVVMGMAVIETAKAQPADHIECRGGMPFGNRVFRDWKKGGHGFVDLHRAIVESCDVYFYQMGNRMGIDAIAHFSNLFGLGKQTGIALSSEKSGLIPSTEWKKRTRNVPWYPGETLSVSIGQGYVSVTPLQMANMIATVANDGMLYPPRLLQKSRDRQTGAYQTAVANAGTQLPIAKETFETVKRALSDVVAAPNGTAAGSRSAFVSIAGKTGTAQVVEMKQGERRKAASKASEDHAWFVAYAPATDPQIAVAVLVEHGGHGSSSAAPRAKKVIEAYLHPTLLTEPVAPAPPSPRPTAGEEIGD